MFFETTNLIRCCSDCVEIQHRLRDARGEHTPHFASLCLCAVVTCRLELALLHCSLSDLLSACGLSSMAIDSTPARSVNSTDLPRTRFSYAQLLYSHLVTDFTY